MLRIIASFVLICLAFSCALVPNNRPLVDSEPKLLATTTNGQKFVIGDNSNLQGDYLYVANLKGTPREMGKALGELFGNEIK